ncbi:hypothetical protein MRX96_056946 [Rhipicephalus microplus]
MAVQKRSCARQTGHRLKPLAEGQVTRIRGKNWATKAKVEPQVPRRSTRDRRAPRRLGYDDNFVQIS